MFSLPASEGKVETDVSFSPFEPTIRQWNIEQ